MSEALQVAERLDAAFNAQDAEPRPWHADAEMVMPGVHAKGREQISVFERAFWAAFPDLQVRIVRQVADGGLVAGEGVLTGAHTCVRQTPQGEVPPTGRRIELPYMRILEVDGDEVVSEHLYFDQLGLLGQLGLAPGAP